MPFADRPSLNVACSNTATRDVPSILVELAGLASHVTSPQGISHVLVELTGLTSHVTSTYDNRLLKPRLLSL